MKNICVSFETTDRYLGIALHAFDQSGKSQLLRHFFKETPAQQAELLIPTFKKLMTAAHITRADLSLISVDVGPGSFTGVRIGLAAARMLAQGLNLPLAGISSLEAIAWKETQLDPRALVVAQLPALQGEVYFAAYQGAHVRVAPCWKPESALKKFLSQNKKAVTVTGPVQPEVLGEVAMARYLKKPLAPAFRYENVVPLYLQPSWAERAKKKK